jgi:hypothetical protein
MFSYMRNHGKEWSSERRRDPAISGRIEPCDYCGQPYRTFRHRPQKYICGPCSPSPNVAFRCAIPYSTQTSSKGD